MKNIRRILAIVMMASIMITLTGCTPDIVGSWKLTGGNALQAIYSLNGSAQLVTNEAEAIFVFEDNGKISLNMTRDDIETIVEGTWKTDGDKVTMTIDGQAVTCTYSINGDVLNLFFSLNGQNTGFILNKN